MPRCSSPAVKRLVLQAAFALSCTAALAPGAFAQVQRNFPANALRGEIAFINPPDIKLNGQPARMAPGSRLRGPDNLLLVSGAVVGQSYLVHYTVDTVGLIKDVWLVRPEEVRGLWPRNANEAAAWRFDPAAQVWTKP